MGNLLPVIPIMLLLRLPPIQRVANQLLERARKKAERLGSASSRALALALFVGVPLPGTGAWTGVMVAFVLRMKFWTAVLALAGGVLMAGVIVTVLCVMGWAGAMVAGAVLVGGGILAVAQAGREGGKRKMES